MALVYIVVIIALLLLIYAAKLYKNEQKIKCLDCEEFFAKEDIVNGSGLCASCYAKEIAPDLYEKEFEK